MKDMLGGALSLIDLTLPTRAALAANRDVSGKPSIKVDYSDS